jgi:hypothetical protein
VNLSTFGITNELQQKADNVEITTADIMVQIKMKSSAFITKPDREPVYDAWGMSCAFPTFVGMLRSKEFAEVHKFAENLAQQYAEKIKSASQRRRAADEADPGAGCSQEIEPAGEKQVNRQDGAKKSKKSQD